MTETAPPGPPGGPVVVRTPGELRRVLSDAGRVGLVPTMGALHGGHRTLMRLAREQADTVVVSIFVNPLQFGPDEDLDRYPRDLPGDTAVCGEEGVDVVFAPETATMYPLPQMVTVDAGAMGERLEGASRPGHFTGVLTDIFTSLNYHRARWLDTSTGRWMSEDPIGFLGKDANLSRLVHNSPLTNVDPTGLAEQGWGKIWSDSLNMEWRMSWSTTKYAANPAAMVKDQGDAAIADAIKVWQNTAGEKLIRRVGLTYRIGLADATGIREISDRYSTISVRNQKGPSVKRCPIQKEMKSRPNANKNAAAAVTRKEL